MVNPYKKFPGRPEEQAEMMTCPKYNGKGSLDDKTCERCHCFHSGWVSCVLRQS
jgi:DnaJ-class molecular chaperone